MKIIKNEKLIKRNGRIGQILSVLALLTLGAGMYITITYPNKPQYLNLSLVALLAGFLLTQIGISMGNRWAGHPRADEVFDTGLKGLPGDYSMYHFMVPAPNFLEPAPYHLLVGPAGIWVLLPYNQRGVVRYIKNRWRLGNGGFFQAYMSLFGQGGLKRPDLESEAQVGSAKRYLAKSLEESQLPEINPVLVFTNEDVTIEAEDTPIPALKLKQVKEFIRKKAKEKPIGQTQLAAIKAALPE